MEAIQGILSQLGIDNSIFYQFTIVLIIFTLARFIFLSKLQFVIELRESKTSKLEQGAEKVLDEANELSEKYQSLIEEAHQKAQNKFLERKKDILEKENEAYKSTEEEVSQYMSSARKEFFTELEHKKKQIFTNVDSLANLLLNKITK